MIETIHLYSRSETVFQLNIHLGMTYDWHHILMMWTTAKAENKTFSVLKCGLQLFPHCTHKRTPLYLPSDVAQFIKDMQARFPELAKPFRFSPSLYEVDTAPAPAFMAGIGHKFCKAKPALPVGA